MVTQKFAFVRFVISGVASADKFARNLSQLNRGTVERSGGRFGMAECDVHSPLAICHQGSRQPHLHRKPPAVFAHHSQVPVKRIRMASRWLNNRRPAPHRFAALQESIGVFVKNETDKRSAEHQAKLLSQHVGCHGIACQNKPRCVDRAATHRDPVAQIVIPRKGRGQDLSRLEQILSLPRQFTLVQGQVVQQRL